MHPTRPLIYVVDDEEMIRVLVRSVLEPRGFSIKTAECADSALRWLETGLNTVDLLITDVRMPGKSGLELASELRARRPELPIVFISGYSGDSSVVPVPEPITAYISKPFALQSLIDSVTRLLSSAPATV